MDELPTPITRSEQYLAKIAGNEPTLPVPITREERYLAKIAGEDVDIPPEPITRTEQYLAAIAENGGGGVEVEALSVTQNNTYTAPEGKAYSPVTVNVPNSYAAGDEGKVVSGGALVAQSSDTVTQNGTVDTTLISSLEVNVSGGGGEAPEKDVNFIDYDGTILYSYTADEFAALDALPANPTHEGLTAQGWNWTLAAAKSYVADFGFLEIGQNFITDDGKTRLHFMLPEEAKTLQVGLGVNGSVVIDWGDNTPTTTLTGTSTSSIVYCTAHTYTTGGEKTITITRQNTSTFSFMGGSYQNSAVFAYNSASSPLHINSLVSVELGEGASLYRSAFRGCGNLKTISIPKGDEYVFNGGDSKFENTYSLECVILPADVKSTGFGQYDFRGSGIKRMAFAETKIIPTSQMFQSATLLQRLSINGKNTDFSSTYSSIANKAYSLNRAAFGNDPTGLNSTHLSGTSVKKFIFPASATSISSVFSGASDRTLLEEVTLPENLTSIGNDTFRTCSLLKSIRIPALVASVGTSCFSSCSSLSSVRFEPTTPPTLVSTSFSSLSALCKLYVPYASLAAYLTASNYPAPATNTYIGFATYNSGVTLPTQDGTEAYNVVWYASKDDAIAQTNPTTEGNGKEIYCRYTAVA